MEFLGDIVTKLTLRTDYPGLKSGALEVQNVCFADGGLASQAIIRNRFFRPGGTFCTSIASVFQTEGRRFVT